MNDTAEPRQSELWSLVHNTLRPKPTDASPNACLNRLTNERHSGSEIVLNPDTALIRDEIWSFDRLRTLDRWHCRMHDFDDDRPLIVVDYDNRHLLVDGNHRVTRWITLCQRMDRRVLTVQLTGKARDS